MIIIVADVVIDFRPRHVDVVCVTNFHVKEIHRMWVVRHFMEARLKFF